LAGLVLFKTPASGPGAKLAAPVTVPAAFQDTLAPLTGRPTNTDCASPDFSINWQSYWGLTIIPNIFSNLIELSGARPLTINGIAVKGLSAKAIDSLVRGPLGSEMTMEVLTVRDVVVKVTMKRTLGRPLGVQRLTAPHCMPIDYSYLNHYLNGRFDRDSGREQTASQDNGIEPYANALAATTLTVTDIASERAMASSPNELFEALVYFDGSGDYQQAEGVLNNIEQNVAVLRMPNRRERETYVRTAQYLERTNRDSMAESIYKKLEALTASKEYWDSSPVRLAYLKMLLRQGRDKEAEALNDKLAQGKFSSGSIAMLLEITSFYAKQGQIDKAITLLENTTREIEAGYREHETQRSFDREKPLSSVAYQLACLQQQAGHNDQALATLQKMIKVCNGRFSASDRTISDQIYRGPSVIDLQIKLADLHGQSENYIDEKKVLEEAVAEREKSLGANSPMLKAPLMDLARTYEKLSEVNKSRELAKRAAALNDPVEDCDLAGSKLQQETYALKLQVAKSLNAHNYKEANERLDKLLTCYEHLGGSLYEAEEASRLWGFFLRTSRLYDDGGRYEDTKKLFSRLRILASNRALPPQAMLAILTEEAIFAKQFGLDPATAWSALEGAISFDNQIPTQIKDHCKSRPDVTPVTPSVINKLRGWALAYIFNHEYKRASHLLERAVSLTVAANTSSQPEVSEHDLAAMELANVEARKNNVPRAQQLNAQILSKYDGCPFELVFKVVQLSDGYESSGRILEAEALLTEWAEKFKKTHGVNSNIGVGDENSLNALNEALVRLLVLRHKPKEALAVADSIKTLDTSTSLLAADLAYDAHDFEKAAHYYSRPMAQPFGHSIEPSPLLLQTATRYTDAAAKATSLSAVERSKIFESAANQIREMQPSQAELLYKRAADLLPEDSRDKDRILQTMVYLRPQPNRFDSIKVAIKSAEREEADRSKRCLDSWAGVASLEIANNQADDGVKHLEHALTLMSPTTQNDILGPLFTFNHTVTENLFKTGRTQDCQRLVQVATKNAEAVYGRNSHEAATEWATQAYLSALMRAPQRVFENAHRALAIYESLGCKLPRNFGSSTSQEIEGLNLAAWALQKVGEKEKAVILMTEIIDTQKRHLAEGSSQLRRSLEFKGRLLSEQGNHGGAALAYSQARDSARKIGFDNADATELSNELRQIGRTSEAAALVTIKGERRASAQYSSLQSEAKLCESQGHIDHARKLFEDAVASSSGEYNEQRLQSTMELASFFERQKDYGRAKTLFLTVWTALERLDGSAQQLQLQETCLRNLTDICLLQRDLNAAGKYFDQMRDVNQRIYQERMNGHRLADFARYEIQLGRRDAAEKDIIAAEDDFKNHPEKDAWQSDMRRRLLDQIRKELDKGK